MILISIGANLPGPEGEGPLESCISAVTEISAIPGLKLRRVSSWYRTGAISMFPQPDFCNGVARVEGEMAPVILLQALQEIEARHGRKRGSINDARTLDLDIIDLNGTIRALPPVILPHPRAHLRAFVLRPLQDVAPGWWHPTLRRAVATLLADLAPQAIEPWYP